jgi:hypothetical protein
LVSPGQTAYPSRGDAIERTEPVREVILSAGAIGEFE